MVSIIAIVGEQIPNIFSSLKMFCIICIAMLEKPDQIGDNAYYIAKNLDFTFIRCQNGIEICIAQFPEEQRDRVE